MHVVRAAEHLRDRLDTGAHRCADAAGLLDGEVLEHGVIGELQCVDEGAHLQHLAAQPQHEDAAEVRVLCVTAKGALQRLRALRLEHEAAAGGVREGHDAVDVLVGLQHAGWELRGDHPGSAGGAVHRGDDADVVAGADATVRTPVAEERRPLAGRRRLFVMHPAELARALRIVHAHVVGVHMGTGADAHRRHADRLPVLADLRSGFDVDECHLVPACDVRAVDGQHTDVVAVSEDEQIVIGHGPVSVLPQPRRAYACRGRWYARSTATSAASSSSSRCSATRRARYPASIRRARSWRAGIEANARVSSTNPLVL